MAQENAAPSIHLTYFFPSDDAILKMQQIKIAESGNATYFEVNSITNGYAGFQQTPDTSFGNPHILISSLWDPNTVGGIYSAVDYNDPTTQKSRFGGEGNGWKTINPYNWKLNTWYNLVNRAWKFEGRLYIGTFINDLYSGKWFHPATLSIADPGQYLTGSNDSFLENWDGTNALWNGSIMREAFFRNCWILSSSGKWEKSIKVIFNANDSEADKKRNGIYHNSFNAYFDNGEDAYCLQHGGNAIPSAAFNMGRTINLPGQINQGNEPLLSTGSIISVTVSKNDGNLYVSWTIDELNAPQLSASLEIIDASGNIVTNIQDILPQRRSFSIEKILKKGTYTARVMVKDIFDHLSQPLSKTFFISGDQ